MAKKDELANLELNVLNTQDWGTIDSLEIAKRRLHLIYERNKVAFDKQKKKGSKP